MDADPPSGGPLDSPDGCDRLLPTREAARRLGRQPAAVRRLYRQGVLPALREGHKLYFRSSDIDEYIRTHTHLYGRAEGDQR